MAKANIHQLGAFWASMLAYLLSKKGQNDLNRTINIDSDKLTEVIDGMGEGITPKEFVKWVNNDFRLDTRGVGFVFGKMFPSLDCRLTIGETEVKFRCVQSREYFEPYQSRIIPIQNDLPKLSEYVVGRSMESIEIQEVTNSESMEFDVFMYTIHLLMTQTEKAKEVFGQELEKGTEYVFHVIFPDGIFCAVVVSWICDWWSFFFINAVTKMVNGGICDKIVFLYFPSKIRRFAKV